MAKSKLTPEMIQNICALIEQGNFIETSCVASGVSKKGFYLWLEKGEADEEAGMESLHVELLHSVREAEARSLVGMVNKIRSEPNGDRWLAARRFRNLLGDRLELQHTGAIEFVVSWDGAMEDDPGDDLPE